MEQTKSAIEVRNLVKKYKKFELDIPELNIPQGYATALIGENGAGKTTLLNLLTGLRFDHSGEIRYYGRYSEEDRENDPYVKESIGYTGTGSYYLPNWRVEQIERISELLFDNFDAGKFRNLCDEMAVFPEDYDPKKKVSQLSDGTKTKLMLAGVLARDTETLILDEPASPLDPLMREKLCDIIRDYLASRPGRTVFFSTHNISDMENVTDYAIIMENGRIVEQGFVESLKEKYILVKGETADAEKASKILFTITKGKYGFEGICLAEDLDGLVGMDVTTETATLFQISVAVMKKSTRVK